MTRVIHIVPAVSEEASGPSYTIVRLCESLIEQGLDVTLAALDWSPMPSPPPFMRTFPLGFGPRRLGRSPAMARWLDDECRAGLFHNNSLWMMPNVYPGHVAKRNGVPYVVSPHGTLSGWAMNHGSAAKKLFWPLVQRPALDAVTCWCATAESEYEDIRHMGFRQPVAIIPNGVDIPPPRESPRDGMRTLLFLGRLHPIKGVDSLLRAWQAVAARFPEWRLRIVGPDDGDYLPTMRSLAVELGLERVEFSGSVYGDAKLDAYRHAELFVLPTHSENFGMAVAEALAAATPAVVTKGAPWSGLETNGAGWWIEIGLDPLVAALEDVLAQPPDYLRTMGARGRAWMEKEFSWVTIAEKMSETYRWILAGADAGKRPGWVRAD